MATASFSDPPLEARYKQLFSNSNHLYNSSAECKKAVGECELPMIDLHSLLSSRDEGEMRKACVEEMAKASSELGFFQVRSHGISTELLKEMRRQQERLFGKPFEEKASSPGILGGSYRWGTPNAASLENFSWSEAFHVPLAKLQADEACCCCSEELKSLKGVMAEVARSMSELARTLAGVLAENLGHRPGGCFAEKCSKETCFLRLNRYPPCPFSPETFGLVPHTDSDFLTVLYQDEVGGLQLMKGSEWVAVRPNLDALIVNIGDLFQAWSNDVYKSVEHKVMANTKVERYSIAYFLCPSYDATIGSCREPSPYKKFTFGEFRRQVQEDVERTGHKVGLPQFRI